MNEQYKISQLAEMAKIPTTTIRYYERIGLLEAEGRSYGNYRLYGEASLEKIRFIRSAQASGFTLNDTKALLSDDAGEVPTCGSVRELIELRLADVEQRLKDLQHIRRVLDAALVKCKNQRPTVGCHVVAELNSRG